jgi:hypothetical protein
LARQPERHDRFEWDITAGIVVLLVIAFVLFLWLAFGPSGHTT